MITEPPQSESATTAALALRIKKVMHDRTTLMESRIPSGKFPDIRITAAGRSPVVIEAKWMHVPENKVENQAREHVNESVPGQPHKIEAAIALRYPKRFATAEDKDDELKKAKDLKYCAVYPKGKRFPTTGWLKGSVCDLADLIHLVDVPKSAFDKAADDLRESIDTAVSVLQFSSAYHLTDKIFSLLGLADVLQTKDLPEKERLKLKNTQTRRIAGAIIANALIFHERIANAHQHIPPIHQVCGRLARNRQQNALDAWEKILEINYWPIFDTAKEIINLLPADKASSILKTLTNAAECIHEDGLLYEHDLTGHVFQRLIIDRKYLAAFYTLPESAALLARLAVTKMNGIDWSDTQEISRLRIADFACGTGALLSAVYDQIANLYERAGGNPKQLHSLMMEQVLYGFDVLPYAAHLTASILSGKEPSIIYNQSRIYTMPYGRQKDETVKIGSLEFLDKPEQRVLFHTGDPAKQVGGKGEETTDNPTAKVQNNSLDLVIMNPPFVRNVTREGAYEGTFAAAFAAFGASDQDQRDMAKRMMLLKQGTCYHASAGMASAFVALADKKLKPGGILALVLPLSVANGSSWQKLRTLLAKNYTNVEVVSLADAKCYKVAFSADTSMADCLVVARKKSASVSSPASASAIRFISLLQRPANFAASHETAKQLASAKATRKLEGGPFGGDEVFCGQQKMGETITTTVRQTKPTWNPARIRDYSLPQTAYKLTQSQLWLPGEAKPLPSPVINLGNIAKTGYYHLQIINGPPNEAPFKRTAPSDTSTHPALWSHNAKQETQIICQPDCQLLVKPGMENRAPTVWKSAGHCHLTQDHTLTSQPLSVAFTKRKCIGGRAWVNINFTKKSWDYAFSLWGNCTLGLLLFWWHGNRQQPGRARITITSARSLPVLDFRALSPARIKQAKTIFDEFKNKRFAPAYVADIDKTRAELDRAVLCDWLGFEESIYQAVRQLASKWCAEPSVHGGKARPH